MKFVSPGVYVREIDLSLYIPTLSTTVAGMVGTATKGPINELTFVSSVNQFIKVFGNPNPDHLMPYAALQFLRRGNQLWVVRVAGSDAASATNEFDAVLLGYVRSKATVTSGVQSFTITSTAFKLKIEVTDARQVTPVVSTDEISLDYGTVSKTYPNAEAMATEITNKLKRSVALHSYVSATAINSTVASVTGSRLHLVGLIPDPLVTFKVLPTAAPAEEAALGLGDLTMGAVTAVEGGVGTVSVATHGYKVSAINGRGESIASAEATVAVTGAPKAVDLSWAAVAGAESYKVYGRTSTGPWGFIASTTTATYTDAGSIVPSATVLAPVASTIRKGTPIALTNKFDIVANSTGIWGNNLTIQFTLNEKQPFRFDIGVYESSPSYTASITSTEAFKGLRIEYQAASSFDSTLTDSWIGKSLGTYNGVPAIPEITTGGSDSVSYRIDTDDAMLAEITEGTSYQKILMPKMQYLTLAGGDDGTSSLVDGDIIGTVQGTTQTGLQLLRNPEFVDINLLMAPGESSAAILNELIAICEERGDCMAILDPPDNYSIQQVVDWHNGTGAFSDHQSFSSSYAALYYPWIEVYDAYNAVNVWTPPSGHVSAVYAYTDFISETWFAPAGFNRAHITAGLRVRYSADQGERDLLYGNGNAVNPIVQFPQDGITIWGQRTLQRAPTALDRVNVRRLLLYMRKVVARAVKYLVFEPNDPATWRQFVNLIEPWCQTVQSRRGIYEFLVICDETTNTPDVIDQNTMVGRIYLKPTKAAEMISVDFVVTNTGASFEESLY